MLVTRSVTLQPVILYYKGSPFGIPRARHLREGISNVLAKQLGRPLEMF